MKLQTEIHNVPRTNNYDIHGDVFKLIGRNGELQFARHIELGDYGYVFTHNRAGRMIIIFEMVRKISENDYTVKVYNLVMDVDEASIFDNRITTDRRTLYDMLSTHHPLPDILTRITWMCI